MPHLNLDKTDLKILQVLQENGRLSNVELSEKVALSPSPCLRRLKQHLVTLYSEVVPRIH